MAFVIPSFLPQDTYCLCLMAQFVQFNNMPNFLVINLYFCIWRQDPNNIKRKNTVNQNPSSECWIMNIIIQQFSPVVTV